MRTLVACARCKHQFDASALRGGSRFRCSCGAVVVVPKVTAHDAAVVRCSACGAPREEGSFACRYCGSDFTIHEQDLETICPSCFARIGNEARFCHHCATPIVPETVAGAETDRVCPACGRGHPLRGRSLDGAGLSALECVRCAGLWIAEEAFRILTDQARHVADPAPDAATVRRDTAPAPRPARPVGPVYRPCPVCSTRMNRVNFGRRSGILIDRCRDHGCWFDAAELDAVLRWIRDGGEVLAEARQREEERQVASAARFRVEPKAPEDAWRQGHEDDSQETGLLPALLRIFSVRT